MSAHQPTPVVHFHYSEHPFVIDRERTYEQETEHKPRGLFLSTPSQNEDGWYEWCVGNRFRLHRLAHCSEVLVDTTHLLFINTKEQLWQFDDDYGSNPYPAGPSEVLRGNKHVNWPAVAETYQGIIIVPHQWECRYDPFWYCTWDCATACIWDLAAVRAVRPVETYIPPPVNEEDTDEIPEFFLDFLD